MEGTKKLEGAIVITGGANGIGEGIARRAAALGMDVAISDIDEERLGEVAESIAAGGTKVLSRVVDVGDPEASEGLAAAYDEFVSLTSERGMTGLQAGEIILDGVARGDFWITTHPAWRAAAAKRRAEVIGVPTDPALPDLPDGGLSGEE